MRIHGMAKSPFYNVWVSMRQRCKDHNSPAFKYYGARGVKVCDRWEEFVNFRDDMYESYMEHQVAHQGKDTSIERIDVEKGYSPDNCKWATREEQNRNKRPKFRKKYSSDGKSMTAVEWSKELGIPLHTVHYRLHKKMPLNGDQQIRTVVNGELLTFSEIAKKYNITYFTVYARYRKGLRGKELTLPSKK